MSAGLHRICCCGGTGGPTDPPPDPWFDTGITVSVFSTEPGGPQLCPVCADGCVDIVYVSDYSERFDPAHPNARTYAFVATVHPVNCPINTYNCFGFAASFGLSIIKEPYTGYDPHTVVIAASGGHGWGYGVMGKPPKAEKTFYRQAGGSEVILSTNSIITSAPYDECRTPESVGYSQQYSYGRVHYQWGFQTWVPEGAYWGKNLATPELSWSILITLEHP
jgi:hypothetical protein